MPTLLMMAIMSCAQSSNIIQRVLQVDDLTAIQKTEIIQEIRKIVPHCPVTPVIIKKND